MTEPKKSVCPKCDKEKAVWNRIGDFCICDQTPITRQFIPAPQSSPITKDDVRRAIEKAKEQGLVAGMIIFMFEELLSTEPQKPEKQVEGPPRIEPTDENIRRLMDRHNLVNGFMFGVISEINKILAEQHAKGRK
jgi:hypothetical protein